jgi:shikimate kinase
LPFLCPMERSWILVGMMGAGKSAIGRGIAEATGREFIDTDQVIQNRFGRSVAQIFETYGEPAFRDHETSVLRSLQPGNSVISTGGGIVMREENWAEMQRLGPTIYLSASVETLVSRLQDSKRKRPLLEGEHWEEKVAALLESRTPFYEKAEIVVNVDTGDVKAASQLVLEELQHRGFL